MPGKNRRKKRDELGPASAGQSGDLQQLSDVADADSESVDELLEEGNAFEAEAVQGVEDAEPPDVSEVTTREVPEDDVPAEYFKTTTKTSPEETLAVHNKRARSIMDAATNLQNMKKLDDSWNAQDLQTFRKYHAKDCIVRWPNQPPTHGIDAHEQEAIAFFKMFPGQHLVNNPYKIMLAQGEWTCTVADFTGTMNGPMSTPDGSIVQPTNKKFHIDFCTVAHWNEQGQIVEENLFYDLLGMLKQIGVMPGQAQKAA